MGKHGYGPYVTDRLGSRCCVITEGLLALAPRNPLLFPLPICVMISHIWPFCDRKEVLATATITKRMTLHMCFGTIMSPRIRRPPPPDDPLAPANIDWRYIWKSPSRWWSVMGFGRLYTSYWPPPYEGRRCTGRSALFTTLYVRPWRGGEARGMAICTRKAYSDIPFDLINIIASYMPAMAKTWTYTSKGRTMHIKATEPDPPPQPLDPPPEDDGEIQEIL